MWTSVTSVYWFTINHSCCYLCVRWLLKQYFSLHYTAGSSVLWGKVLSIVSAQMLIIFEYLTLFSDSVYMMKSNYFYLKSFDYWEPAQQLCTCTNLSWSHSSTYGLFQRCLQQNSDSQGMVCINEQLKVILPWRNFIQEYTMKDVATEMHPTCPYMHN